jgi:predicted glycoside hydrolase/deacetylase ChbG (UPF0249 family)
MKYLIVNGDDFGASPGVNRGMIEAHCRGILTSASLLMNTMWTAEAVTLAREVPELSLGLHADLDFELKSAAAGAAARVRHALRLQFARFVEWVGAPPTHLDSHHNVHRDPRALPHLLELATEQKVPLREHSPVHYYARFYGRWNGQSHPEQISAQSLAAMMAREIGAGVTELSCHPGYVDADLASDYTDERELELRALCDPALRPSLARHGIQLLNYHGLGHWLANHLAAQPPTMHRGTRHD